MDYKKLDKMVSQFMDDSVPYKHRIAPHIEDILKEVVIWSLEWLMSSLMKN